MSQNELATISFTVPAIDIIGSEVEDFATVLPPRATELPIPRLHFSEENHIDGLFLNGVLVHFNGWPENLLDFIGFQGN